MDHPQVTRFVPIGLTPNDPIGRQADRQTLLLPTTSCVLRSQPDRHKTRLNPATLPSIARHALGNSPQVSPTQRHYQRHLSPDRHDDLMGKKNTRPQHSRAGYRQDKKRYDFCQSGLRGRSINPRHSLNSLPNLSVSCFTCS